MSFYPCYQTGDISTVVRGLGALIEGGKWIHWSGDGGAWRDLTPPMEEWDTVTEGPFSGARGLSGGRTLRFSRYDRDVSWPKRSFGEGHPLTPAEIEHLYAIYERVYLIPEREANARRREEERAESEQASAQWLEQLAAAGRAAA